MSAPLRIPVLRHLAWLAQAPRLYSGQAAFDSTAYLPHDWLQTLQMWEQHPDLAPSILWQPPPRRLGAYFETLYAVLLQHLLGWRIEARNLQVIVEGHTLGELDFLVTNPLTGKLEHHEIAVKFYLGFEASDAVHWVGPNSRDTLARKEKALRERQSRLTDRPETAALLAQRGYGPVEQSRIFMPGYLFQPVGRALPVPAGVEHVPDTSHWCHRSRFEPEAGEWVLLEKPNWLGPFYYPGPAHFQDDAVILSAREATEYARTLERPGLLARLEPFGREGGWQEVERIFIVPDVWPGSSYG
ncbi:DUF1853 family protein [Marinobacterium sp. AK62]|uniref:DUF1853 family protein n=1 Tax=Marinobacterium alkalitolerans TaxID=1542925 RepID=A0ABS3Z8F2_9GAMM|nr:DUF1853 family protein [Marinobacterium alkalitolerans]MBP0047995.1 DUF1853 family protein [Marinobacterium alkalitolerans]